MEFYSENGHATTPKGRENPLPELPEKERLELVRRLKEAGALTVETAIARSERSTLDKAGRQWGLRRNIGIMIRQLIFWDEKGEVGGGWIHKTAREWEREAGLTRAMLRTARKRAVEEGLIERKPGHRPGDRQNTVFYRLRVLEVSRRVVVSELENVRAELSRERRKQARDTLNKRRRELEAWQEYINRVAERDLDNPEPRPDPVKLTGEPSQIRQPTEDNNKRITSVGSLNGRPFNEPTPVGASGASTQAREIMNNIYTYLKDSGFRLDNEEFRFNLAQVDCVLNEDQPTETELADLPKACEDYFAWFQRLDVAKALRRRRQQARRSKLQALSEPKSKGRHIVEMHFDD
jgi:hypothetical protein